MYCYHCGKKFNEHALEAKKSSYDVKDTNGELVEIDSDAVVSYVCPQCGHLTHANASDEELKQLSRAAHAQLQRGANAFARGMAMLCLGAIIGILAITFLLLSYKTSGGVKTLNTSVSTFYVFVGMAAMAVILLGYGVVSTVIGIQKKVQYTALLKDLNNKTFVQQEHKVLSFNRKIKD